MPPRVVLVTGVSRYLGSRLASILQAEPGIERVIGVDVVPPRGDSLAALGRTEFVRADIRNPIIAKVLSSADVDTVVHMNMISAPMGAGGRSAMKEINVIGTMQLLGACQKAPSLRKLVMKSTTAVYGSSPQDPALFTEEMEPRTSPRSGYARDAIEVEGYARGFARRRPDVTVTMLRFTNFIGPRIETPLTAYFSLPVVPTVFGFDPRLQLCHEDDGLEVLRQAAVDEHPGIYNVGGNGILLLSQAIRRAGRVSFPVLAPAVSVLGRAVRSIGVADFSRDQLRFLEHGRVVDTTALRQDFGYSPRYSSAAAFADFVAGRQLRPVISPGVVARIEHGVVELATGGRAT